MKEISREEVYSNEQAREVLNYSVEQFKTFLRKNPEIPRYKLLRDKRFTYYSKEAIDRLAEDLVIFVRVN